MKRQSPLAGVNLLDLAPVRFVDWEEVAGRVVLLRPRPRGFVEHLSYYMSAKRIRLDAIGTFAWLRLDGKATVADIAG